MNCLISRISLGYLEWNDSPIQHQSGIQLATTRLAMANRNLEWKDCVVWVSGQLQLEGEKNTVAIRLNCTVRFATVDYYQICS